jgi:hypothetical protein
MDWATVVADLDAIGHAVTPVAVLDGQTCAELCAGFDDDELFRSTVDMARHRFGEGTYRYYRYPLPPAVQRLREEAYVPLAALATEWSHRLGSEERFPATLADYVASCHARSQPRPTPLILRYDEGGYNALHQDLYGAVAFPFQLTVALTEPGTDFTGGENLLVEQRPRAQSRGTAITVPLGHALVFPNRYRPVPGARGSYRVNVRHGVSTVTSGRRLSLGVIFHDAT